MSNEAFSEEIFSSSPSAVVAAAAAAGRIWPLQQYLEFWCETHDFAPNGVTYLVEAYRALSCHSNCWYLWWKYLRPTAPVQGRSVDLECRLGLDCGAIIRGGVGRWASSPDPDMWKERDQTLAGLCLHPESLEGWIWLVGQYCMLEQLLEAVWVLFVIKMNSPLSTAVSGEVQNSLECIRVAGTSGSLWSFPGRPTFVAATSRLMASDQPREEIARRISGLIQGCFDVEVKPQALLRSFPWGRR